MAFLHVIALIERVPARYAVFLFESGSIIDVNDGVRSSTIEELPVRLLPVGVPDFELYFRDGYDLFESEAGGIPEVDG